MGYYSDTMRACEWILQKHADNYLMPVPGMKSPGLKKPVDRDALYRRLSPAEIAFARSLAQAGATYKEIGRLLGRTPGAVARRLRA